VTNAANSISGICFQSDNIPWIKDASPKQRFCVRLINASHKTFNILNQSWLQADLLAILFFESAFLPGCVLLLQWLAGRIILMLSPRGAGGSSSRAGFYLNGHSVLSRCF